MNTTDREILTTLRTFVAHYKTDCTYKSETPSKKGFKAWLESNMQEHPAKRAFIRAIVQFYAPSKTKSN